MIQKSNKTVIPEAFQFLLEFTNLPFKQGIASVFRPKKKLKRTPTIAPKKPKPLAKETIAIAREYCKKEGFVDSETDKFIESLKKNRGAITTDRKGVEYSWSLNKGRYKFDGGNKCYPSSDEFEAFFKSKDVVNTATYGELLGAVELCRCILNSQVNLNNDVVDEYASSDIWTVIEKYRKFLPEDLRKRYLFNYRSDDELDFVLYKVRGYIHDGKAPLRIYAELLNFIHSNYATLLRQCSYCGRFWIKNDKRKFFCSCVCSQRSDDQIREVNKEASTKSKKHKRKNDKNKIMDVLKRKHGDDAEKYYKQEIEGKISSYKDFVRRKGKFYNPRR